MSGSTDQSLALFEACFQGDSAKVANLLEGPGADELLREAAGGVTLLHAAVLGGAAAALPLLAADGAPLDAEIPWEQPPESPPQVAPAASAFLQSFGYTCDEFDAGCTALNLAVRMRTGAAVEQLLLLGARPDAGLCDWGTARCALHTVVDLIAGDEENVFESIVRPFLRRGLEPLVPESACLWHTGSLFRSSCGRLEMRQQLLAYLEGLHDAGQLRLNPSSSAELIWCCCRAGLWDHPLVEAGIAAVQATFDAGAAPDSLELVLVNLLSALVDSPQPAPLRALLSISLPLPLHLRSSHTSWAVPDPFPNVSVSLPVRAALSKTAHKDNWRLLQQAGAPVTADNLYNCIDELSSTGVMAVLACRLPAVNNTSQPVSTPQGHASIPGYSCPIHRTLHALTQAPWDASHSAIVILEWLRWAGYRPCTWRNSAVPAFLQPSERQRVLPLLDPFDLSLPAAQAALA